jgi:spindle assembly abnormal protein 6
MTTPSTYLPKPSSSGFKFNNVLFDHHVHVRVKCHDREDFTQGLNVKLNLHAQQVSTTSQQHVLTFELTDPLSNPYFLYTVDISESDFHLLRQQQNFRFDFQSFPAYIIKHLEQSGEEGAFEKRVQCQLEVGVSNEAAFLIHEITQYIAIPMLQLRLKQGNDEAVKRHLAGKWRETREAMDGAHSRIA